MKDTEALSLIIALLMQDMNVDEYTITQKKLKKIYDEFAGFTATTDKKTGDITLKVVKEDSLKEFIKSLLNDK